MEKGLVIWPPHVEPPEQDLHGDTARRPACLKILHSQETTAFLFLQSKDSNDRRVSNFELKIAENDMYQCRILQKYNRDLCAHTLY